MQSILKAFSLAILLYSIGLCQSKDDYLIDHKKIIQNEFEYLYGLGWQFSFNKNNTPHRILGKSISQNFDGLDPIQSEKYAREFISKNQFLFNIENDNLQLWVNEKNGNLRYLIFNQIYQNIPVWNGRIDFRYRLDGGLVMIGHDAFPDLKVNTAPSLSADQAIFYSKIQVDFDEALNDKVVGDPELNIWVKMEKQPSYHLAWKIELLVHSTDPTDELPIHRWKIFVDAHNGDILEQFDEVRMATVEGHVSGPVKDEPYGIATDKGMPNVKIDIPGIGTTYTDENGYYSIDVGDSERSVNVKLEGSYLNTNNANGSDATITRTVSPGTTEDFSFGGLNSIPGERDTYYHANVIHDHAKSIHSGLTGADYVMPAKVNIGSEDYYWPCNAYWDYTGINLFSAGGGCAATDQMADVVYHEYGHGLQQFIYDPYSPN